MNNPAVAAFIVVYNAWLDIFRSMIPGGPATPPAEPTPKALQAAAVQEWEDEGGSIKPDKTHEDPSAIKIPL